MKIFEFDVPLFRIPFEPYWILEENIVIFPTNTPTSRGDFSSRQNATRIVLFDIDPNLVKKKITDLVIILNFLNWDQYFFQWMLDKALSGGHLSRFESEVDNISDYVEKENRKPGREPDWLYIVDYSKYPLYEFTNAPNRVNFGQCFRIYSKLQDGSKDMRRLKELIDFFSYNSLSRIVSTRVYDNVNLEISTAFLILESLAVMDVKDRKTIKSCPKCGFERNTERHIKDIVAEYISGIFKDSSSLDLMLQIADKHYKTRNRFFHAAKFDKANDLINNMIDKTGSSTYYLRDEIQHARASRMGLQVIHEFLRHAILDKIGYSDPR